MNSTRNTGSVWTQISTAIVGLTLVGYGLAFIVNAVIQY